MLFEEYIGGNRILFVFAAIFFHDLERCRGVRK